MSYVLDGLVYVLGHSVFRLLMMALADISFWLSLAVGVFFVGYQLSSFYEVLVLIFPVSAKSSYF